MKIKTLVFTGLLAIMNSICFSQLDYKGFVYDGQGDLLLDEPNCIINSKDDRFIYVSASGDDAVSVFMRDTATGLLTCIESYKDGIAGVDGLQAVSSITISQDNRFLYATGYSDYALAAFSRDTLTGRLEFIDVYYDGQGGIDGLFAPQHAAISYDNKSLYVAGYADDAIAVFSRNIVTGELTFVEVQHDGIAGVDGLDGIRFICLSLDDEYVYAAGAGDDAIAVFSRNTSTGELTFIEMLQDNVGGVDGLDMVNCLAISPDNKHLYAAGRVEHAVSVFSRNTTDGTLSFIETHKDGTGGINNLYGAWHVMINHPGKYVYVSAYGDGAIVVFSRDTLTGELTLANEITGFSGINFTLLGNDDRNLYTSISQNDKIEVNSYDTATGEFVFMENHQHGLTGIDGLKSIDGLAVENESRFLYTISSGDVSLCIFSIDPVTGEITFVKDIDYTTFGYGRHLTVSPDNMFLYANNSSRDRIYLYSRNLLTGDLSLVEEYVDGEDGIEGMDGANHICIPGNNKFLYVSGISDDAIASFSRNTGTGELTYTGVVVDGENGADGLDYPNGMAASPDNKFLYVASHNDNAVSVFSCDSVTGELTYIEMVQDGVGGVDGLYGCWDVTVTGDSGFLYAISMYDDAISLFSRDKITGQLTFIEMYKNGENGITGLDEVYSIALSADNRFIYTVANDDNTLNVFLRDTVTGELTLTESHRDGINGVDGLGSPRSVAVSPNNRFVYAGGYSDNAVSVFEAIIPVDLGSDTTFCYGDSLVLDAGAGFNYHYEWSEGSSSQILTVKQTDIYSVFVTDGSGRTGGDTVDIEVIPEVMVSEDKNICYGDSVILTVQGGEHYQWSTSDTTTEIVVYPSSTTIYTVEVSIAECPDPATVDIHVQVNDLPALDLGNDTTIYLPGTLLLQADVNFEEYLWSTGSGEASVTVDNDFGIGEHIIWVKVTDENNCHNSDTITVIIEEGTDNPEFLSEDATIEVYPNPAYDKVNISVNNSHQATNIEVISMKGDVLYTMTFPASESKISGTIDISTFSSGIYLVKIRTLNSVKVKKLIIE